MRVAIIADDLTGALDTASPFACHGARVLCLTEPEAIAAADISGIDVLSVSTNSRHLEPAQASNIVRKVAETIRLMKPDIVLKKVDSRLKGNVVAETEEVANVLGHTKLLVVPAAPDIGRFVQHGRVVGKGVDAPIVLPAIFGRTNFFLDMPDVSSADEMTRVAQRFLSNTNVLPVCSRGFGVALAGELFPMAKSAAQEVASPALIAIGSLDAVTTSQRLSLCAQDNFTCVEAPQGHVPATLPRASHVLLYCSGSIAASSEVVARSFADGVHRAVSAMTPRTLLCTGGDTALAVLRKFGLSALRVKGEVAPGLPISTLRHGGFDMNFISKSGGFGGASTLLELFPHQSDKFGT